MKYSNVITGDQEEDPLFMRNLLNDTNGLAGFLRQEMARGAWMNAFLLAAGINQIVEDYLHLDPLFLHKAALVISRDTPPFFKPFSWIVQGMAFITDTIFTNLPHFRRLFHWQEEWAKLVQDLAEQALLFESARVEDPDSQVTMHSAALLATMQHFPDRLLRSVLHIPSCFRGFDQVPEDFYNMVLKFSRDFPDRNRQLVIVGIRTAGNYLGPLFRVFLLKMGYLNITVLTQRPGALWLPSEKEHIQAAVQDKALFLVVDDPPASGHSFLKSCLALERIGVPRENMILFIALFKNREGFPKCLEAYNAVILPWEEWTIHQRLDPLAIQDALTSFVDANTRVSRVERLPSLPDTVERGHLSALYQVALTDLKTGESREQKIFVKGVGYAYFGEHSLAVIRDLSQNFPRIYGLMDGLLFREWQAEEKRLPIRAEGHEQAAARAIVDYTVARHRLLAVPQDLSVRLLDEGPAWEVASNMVSHVFGRAWWVSRLPIVDPLMRQILSVSHPSIIDGNMSPSHWFLNGSEGHLIKISFDEGVFRNDIEFTCYDPIFDLASLAADLDYIALEGSAWARDLFESLRPLYQSTSGEEISEERWLIYQFVRLWDLQREQTGVRLHHVQRTFSRALQRYYAAIYFQSITRPSSGPICAIDIDGVLETNYLGFPGLSPASADALRSLVLHGNRPVLATGRSLPEVIDRCSAYPFVGAVAEYGAVTYDPVTGNIHNLLSEDEQVSLNQLREILRAIPGVMLNPDYHFAVRAYRINTTGQGIPLSSTDVTTALEKLGKSDLVCPIPGESQTDFMVTRINKRTGLRALLKELQSDFQSDNPLPIAFGVGDTISDLPMLEMAKFSCVPAHARIDTENSEIRRMRRPYQAGFAQAVHQLIGHSPGTCPLCFGPPLLPDSKHLLTLFSAQETGLRSMFHSALLLTLARVMNNLKSE